MADLHKAIYNIHTNVKSIDGDTQETITAWDKDGNVVVLDESKIASEMVRLQAEWNSQEYARNRKAEYDQLNQFEMQFDDDRDGTTTWVDTINEIKGRHPK